MLKVGVFGISGVGKSTLIWRASEVVPILHLIASDLIKARLARQSEQASSEQLRTGPVLDNQRLMIDEFRDRVSNAQGIVVFDGHTIVDAPEGIIEVPIWVFKELGLDGIVFIEDMPEAIMERRAGDSSRVRPGRDAETLKAHQDLAKARAVQIANALGVPISFVTSGNGNVLAEALSALDAAKN